MQKTYFPITEILLLIGFSVILIIILSFCVHCRIQSKKKSKLKSTHVNVNGAPIFYRYSPANSSVDYLGKLKFLVFSYFISSSKLFTLISRSSNYIGLNKKCKHFFAIYQFFYSIFKL
jgi:hypothetical protein